MSLIFDNSGLHSQVEILFLKAPRIIFDYMLAIIVTAVCAKQ